MKIDSGGLGHQGFKKLGFHRVYLSMVAVWIAYHLSEKNLAIALWPLKDHDDIHAILKSWTPADVLRNFRKTLAGELIPVVVALRVLSSRLKRDRLFRPQMPAPQKHTCKLVGVKNRLKADLKERSRTKVNFDICMWLSQQPALLAHGLEHNTAMPDIKFNSKLNLQVGLTFGFHFYLKWLVMASPDFVMSQRMSAGMRVEILLYKEMCQGFNCGGLFCFQSRNLNCISVSNGVRIRFKQSCTKDNCFIQKVRRILLPALLLDTCESKLKMKLKLE